MTFEAFAASDSALETLAPLALTPVFDAALGIELLGVGEPAGLDFYTLAIRGAIVRDRAWWRLDDSVREFLLRYLASQPEIVRSATSTVVHAMSNGSRPLMESALGVEGAELRRRVLLVLELGTSQVLNALIDWVDESGRNGRLREAEVAARQLGRLPGSEGRRRELALLLGLAAWEHNRRIEAAEFFAEVTRNDVRDRAWAIAAHLQGVQLASDGHLSGAIDLVRAATRLLREVGDQRGLAMALTTLGRFERDLVATREDSSSDSLLDPVTTLREAVRVSESVGLEEYVRALISLAATLRRLGEDAEGLAVAQQAATLLDRVPDSPSWTPLLLTLASLLRSAGANAAALASLRTGLERTMRSGNERDLAKLLNVLAATEHSMGNGAAEGHARESVDLGGRLGDEMHIMHALHTLARILSDDPRRTQQANVAASQALQIALHRHDALATSMIRTTIARIRRQMSGSAHASPLAGDIGLGGPEEEEPPLMAGPSPAGRR